MQVKIFAVHKDCMDKGVKRVNDSGEHFNPHFEYLWLKCQGYSQREYQAGMLVGRVQQAWSKRPRVMLSLCSRSDSQILFKVILKKIGEKKRREMIMSRGGIKPMTWQMAYHAPTNWATKSFDNSVLKFKYGWAARNLTTVGYPSCHTFII